MSKRSPATEEQVELFRKAMGVLEGKWTLEILWHLTRGTKRFGELKRAMPGISQRMLSGRLRDLEAQGLIQRAVKPGTPPQVEYSVGQATTELGDVFDAVIAWARKYVRA